MQSDHEVCFLSDLYEHGKIFSASYSFPVPLLKPQSPLSSLPCFDNITK